MPPSLPNHTGRFRPLRGGIAVLNPVVGKLGTLGAILTRGSEQFVLSAYHVLVRDSAAPAVDGEPIYQPVDRDPQGPVAHVHLASCLAREDVGVAALAPPAQVVGEILGLPPVCEPVPPSVGMRVLKSGIATGITEGVVVGVEGGRVRIEPVENFAPGYALSRMGDSGSVWIERSSGAAVAMHIRGSDTGPQWAEAVPMVELLSTLGMSLLLPARPAPQPAK